ncbi:retrovirus-related pol polyprotein from transposon TNT 1-94 [Tanacetum coccineum]
MHNNIMAAGQPATDDSPAVLKRTVPKTFLNISTENKAHFDAEVEAIHLILTEIGDDIYSTVDACTTSKDMWIAIERLQQGESLNKQDVKTNLFWEFGRFTSRDGESIESYYSMFYKMMNEMERNQLEVATMQVNVQFLQQLQPEWSRFVTIVKQPVDLDKESYRKLFDILKQYQIEGNEISAEKIARNANLLALFPQRSHHPTINNLKTSSNTRKKNVDTSPRYKNENQTEQFGNQRTMTVVEARETVGNQVMEQTKIQCFNCKEFGNFAKECRKTKRANDYTYHKEKMLMCKQAEKGVPLHAEQSDWLDDTDEKIDEQELEAHYSFMAKIQEHSEQPESINDTYVGEKVDNNVIPNSSGMCDNENQADQNAEECDDERVMLANLIANLKLDTDENKKIQKQLKKANTSLAHELQECKSALEKCKSSLEESNRTRDRYLGALHDQEVELAK